jgi:hypothetical protein
MINVFCPHEMAGSTRAGVLSDLLSNVFWAPSERSVTNAYQLNERTTQALTLA